MVEQELIKLLKTRNVFIFIVAVIIINGFVLWGEENNNISRIHSKPEDYKNIWNDITSTQDFDISSLYENLGYLNDINEFDNDELAKLEMYTASLHLEIWLYEEIIAEIEDSVYFNEYIHTIIENTNRLIKKNKENADKTRELKAILGKYEGIADTETKIGPSRAITTITNNRVTDYLAVAIIIVVSIILLPLEYDREWLDFFKSMKRGNYCLGMAKVKVIVLSCIALGLLQIENMIISICLYGVGDISRSVQSISGFQSCTWDISVFGYLAVFAAIKILCYILFGIITFGIFSVCKKTIPAVVSIIVFFTISIVLNSLISELSSFGWSKMFLPFVFFDVYSYMNGVHYINFGPLVVDKNIVLLLIWCIYICLFTICGLVFFQKETRINRSVKYKCSEKLLTILRINNSLFVFENLKVYLYNKTIILLLGGMVMTYLLYSYPIIDNNLEHIYYREMANQYAGDVKDNTVDDISIMLDRYNMQLADAYVNCNDRKIYSLSAAISAGNKLLEHAEYLKTINNSGIFDTTAYDVLIDTDLNSSRFIALYVAIISCLVFSSIFVKDYENNEVALIKSMLYGVKRKAIYQIIICLFIAAVIFLFSWLPMIIYLVNVCDLSGMNYSAACLEKLRMIPPGITLFSLFGIVYMKRYLGIVLVALICFVLAKKLKHLSITVAAAMGMIVLPICFSIVGIKWFDYVLITPFLIGCI